MESNSTTGIDSAVLADLRCHIEDGEVSDLSGFSLSGFSIGAAVELACIRNSWSSPARALVENWRGECPWLNLACRTYDHGIMPSRQNLWAARTVDFFPIRGTSWNNEQEYHPFESRFTKGAKLAGFGNSAVALAGAMFEMADNIVQHSEAGSNSIPPHGLMGYGILPGHLSFSIADAGRGALASLKQNPSWAGLPDSRAALLAILQNHASRRAGMGQGEGFKELFRSIANLNGIVDVRSYDGRATLRNHGDGRQIRQEFIGFAPGFQITVSCSIQPPACEKIFSVDILT